VRKVLKWRGPEGKLQKHARTTREERERESALNPWKSEKTEQATVEKGTRLISGLVKVSSRPRKKGRGGDVQKTTNFRKRKRRLHESSGKKRKHSQRP